MPKVSVVIPCYNYARFLPDAVESVMAQTYRDFEVVIVNDGSPDDTRQVAEGLIVKYGADVISLIDQENAGVSEARNRGIRECRGDYVIPLDADDMLKPRFLESTVQVLDTEPGVDVVSSWFESFGSESRTYTHAELTRKALLMNEGQHPNIIFRKTAWAKAGGYKSAMVWGYEDLEFNFSLFEAGCRAKVVPEVLFMYRKHGPSRLGETQRNILKVNRRLKLLHPRLFEPFLCSLSPALAMAVIWLKSWTRDPVMHYIYIKHPGVHERLRTVKYGLFVR